MGDWKYENGAWTYDSGAPDADPTVTSMLPVYAGATDTSTGPVPVVEPKTEFTHADGSTYRRVDPTEFPCFDQVDSRTIVDDGAPA